MGICNNCLEKNWKFEFIDGWVRATCQLCANEVEFETKKLKRQNKENVGIKTEFA